MYENLVNLDEFQIQRSLTMEITVRNVNHALSAGLWWLKSAGVVEPSRNGPVWVSPEPVLTTYKKPVERVLFDPRRDANPYFHLFEALWMLAGKDDIGWPIYFNSKFGQYSDDGRTLNGAYGYRWREHFGKDQVSQIIEHMKKNRDTRRAVLQIWDPVVDLPPWSKDHPCNIAAIFDLRGNALNMTVCNRSNDVIFGAYGANAVHFSMLQEYVAAALEASVGVYRQFSNNYHVYIDMHGSFITDPPGIVMYYDNGTVRPYPLVSTDITAWNEDLSRFMTDPCGDTAYHDSFFDDVAAPLYASWFDRKTKKNNGMLALSGAAMCDWTMACQEWIERRKHDKRQDSSPV